MKRTLTLSILLLLFATNAWAASEVEVHVPKSVLEALEKNFDDSERFSWWLDGKNDKVVNLYCPEVSGDFLTSVARYIRLKIPEENASGREYFKAYTAFGPWLGKGKTMDNGSIEHRPGYSMRTGTHWQTCSVFVDDSYHGLECFSNSRYEDEFKLNRFDLTLKRGVFPVSECNVVSTKEALEGAKEMRQETELNYQQRNKVYQKSLEKRKI